MNVIPFTLYHSVTFLLWACSFVMVIYAGYYGIVTLFALKKCKEIPTAAPKHRFAVLIAARNEAQVIGNLVYSLKQQNYPKDLYEIFVIPNNCTDNTREAALKAGATILDCKIKVRQKGQVLQFAINEILKNRNHFDSFCIFDADNLADPDFLQEMNQALCSGIKVAQGYRDSKNPLDTIISANHTIYYYSINRLYNHARSVLGLSAVINGTGFMVSAETIKDLGGWNTVTMTEDLEFCALCALNGIRIGWVPKAVFYDEQPLTFSQSWHQRMRWSTGMQQCLSFYWRPLLKAAAKRRSLLCTDLLLMFTATHMQIAGFLSFLLTITLTVLHISYNLFPQTDLAFKLFISFDTSYATSLLIAVSVLLLENKNPLPMLKGILTAWFFIASWIPINCICLFKKDTEWKQIEHTRSLALSDLPIS
ncbi:glycosyltransferase family 2 protein [Sinanaerobacter chloroacetimidivorans]|uniref:Glycosyltransferase family 2 protein n=1 Tax=Sinanaerobacter chloroacetimidivorans TaxID=2818044 RepID=A0A8J7VZX5_9FIRM|nr:glycosyltransferase family 2 protein [Sinanaerobacter chloroacetimidivorans]MBR0598232.1 glycosyltransferase family 2 protein [Sinanaerobacter chloroacetimidivorans]